MRRLIVLGTWLLLGHWPPTAVGDPGGAPTGPEPEARDAAVRPAQAPGRPPVPPVPPPALPPAPTARPGGAVLPPAPGQPPGQPVPPSSLALALAPLAPAPSAVPFPSGPGLTSLERASPGGIPLMLGDMAPIFGPVQAQAVARGPNAVRLAWVRGYKMADNQSPWPLDRVFVSFSFYDDLNLGPAARVPLRDVRVYREFFGLEKTFLDDRNASIGLRLPLNTISARGLTPGLGGTSTALGDLTVFGKYALWYDRDLGNVAMAGLAVTPPTGPREFAGAPFARARSPVYFQPFLGFVKTFGPLFVQGFTGINVPTDGKVVTMLYNDVGVGTFLFQSADPCRLVGAVVPTMEVHVNTPLNHRGGFSAVRDPGATFDVVDLTFGLSVWLRNRAVLSVGFSEPVTGPRPFAGEFVLLLNVLYGGARRRVPPPLLGG